MYTLPQSFVELGLYVGGSFQSLVVIVWSCCHCSGTKSVPVTALICFGQNWTEPTQYIRIC